MSADHSPLPFPPKGMTARQVEATIMGAASVRKRFDALRSLNAELVAALEDLELAQRYSYSWAFCGPQPRSEETREQERVIVCRASTRAQAVIDKARQSAKEETK